MVFFALCKEIFEFLIGGVPEHVGKISIKQVFFFGEMRWKMYLCGKQIKMLYDEVPYRHTKL